MIKATTTRPLASFSAVSGEAAKGLPLFVQLPQISHGSASSNPLCITRVVHASVLIQFGSEALLTDPWFSEKPLYHPGEKLGLAIDSLPRLAGVLTSMNHYDHFDIAAFAAYRDRAVPFIVIDGNQQRESAMRAGFQNVHALKAWESVRLGSFLIHAIPANPTASPSDFVYEQAYVIEAGDYVILFCAHFLKEPALSEVARRFPRIDLALLGINGLRVKPWLWRQLSMDPVDAAKVCHRVAARVAVPIHYSFDGGWLSTTFLVQHKGKPTQFSERVRCEAPETTAVTIAPGQTLELVREGSCGLPHKHPDVICAA
jgi:L-ascorbate metabolism protein UlaG (beta-lactamase superfamily)